MNPIIYIDELDKISQTGRKRDYRNFDTFDDSTQNDQFTDKYFAGIDIDLSKVLFIFSYNDFSKDRLNLAYEIHRVKFRHPAQKDKSPYRNPTQVLETVGFNGMRFHFH